ncbi:carboxyl-terminal-processing peptidase 2, chloroplastic [Nicotiana tomentosiformis]|uniref:carboxyl-terminal-processing peptidase 2, chloroplastic n=1 Tax=Nicotiana tomentosiformis TaxID=4098 RepID=UPI00051B170C|nr:carboxyl-terminal-processing peptidase 2, chloroplastic [Nicotiana tomentosiformis]
MEALLGSSHSPSASVSPSFIITSSYRRNPTIAFKVLSWNSLYSGSNNSRLYPHILCLKKSGNDNSGSCPPLCYIEQMCKNRMFSQPNWRLSKIFLDKQSMLVIQNGLAFLPRKFKTSLCKTVKHSEIFRNIVPDIFVRSCIGLMLVMAVNTAVAKAPSFALTEENLLFLEAWRTIDRAYIDKTFNGQSWFRYREDALRNEPMNTRQETYAAIKKMIATLDDPFTRFLEPEKFKSLRSGTQNALTGVGLSIGYPTGNTESAPGLVVVSASPGGPANRAGISSGDIILEIDNTSTENMGIYDAAERLQGPEGSGVELTVRRGSETRQLPLIREKVSLNPVKSRICKLPTGGNDAPQIGYIKLSTFNQNASGAVREAIEALRKNNVNAFVLDLRDNSGGLFPEGVEIAKIWLNKGVIVYICDSRGVRDIYDTDGSNVVAASEPLAVLVNKGTASASEILAGALKDNKRAQLFGEPTYGKGKIQSVFQLSDGSGLAVTVARYETPAHNDIDKVGVIPDHPLPASFPKDDESFCNCLLNPASACHLNRVELFSN